MKKLGNTSEERQKNFEEMTFLYNEENLTLDDIGKRFGVSRQAINQFMVKRGFIPNKEKDIKFKQHRKMAQDTILKEKLKLLKREKENQRIYKIKALGKANKYKQALKEIKQELEESIYCESQECGCDDAKECLECMKKLILEKCEVLKCKA